MIKTSQKGFTLIEILIAIAIFSIVMGGIYSVYETQNRSYLVQQQVASIQQNLRSAMFMIGRDARNAGCMIDLENIADGDVSMVASMEGIEAFNNFEDAGPDRVDFLFASFRDATQISDKVMPQSSAILDVWDPSGFEDGNIAIISNGTHSNIMEITHVSNSPGSKKLQHNPGKGGGALGLNNPTNDNFPTGGYETGSWVYKGKYSAFRIGYADDDTDQKHPQLQVDLDGVVGSKYDFQAVAQNIEDLQIKYIL